MGPPQRFAWRGCVIPASAERVSGNRANCSAEMGVDARAALRLAGMTEAGMTEEGGHGSLVPGA